jgi:hypothetical protein
VFDLSVTRGKPILPVPLNQASDFPSPACQSSPYRFVMQDRVDGERCSNSRPTQRRSTIIIRPIDLSSHVSQAPSVGGNTEEIFEGCKLNTRTHIILVMIIILRGPLDPTSSGLGNVYGLRNAVRNVGNLPLDYSCWRNNLSSYALITWCPCYTMPAGSI